MALDANIYDESLPAINADSADHGCFGCGDANPHGLRLRFRPLPRGGIWGRFTPDESHQGYLSMTHGGIIATVLDEAMSWAITFDGDLGVTTRLSLTFRQPARIGDPLLVVARVTARRGRLIDATATVHRIADDACIAEAEGRFVRVSRQQADAWRDAYATADPNSAFARAAQRNAGGQSR